MNSAYNPTWLRHLHIIKACKQWADKTLITPEQLAAIRQEHPVSFFHPNLFIRILLFLATFIALAGVTGLLGLFFIEAMNNEEAALVLSLVYGLVSFVVLDRLFIHSNRHYKSGVTEALLYHAAGFTIFGASALFDYNDTTLVVICMVVFSFAAFRYLDLISTVCAFCSVAYFLFSQLYQAGGIVQQLIPIAMIVCFTPVYFGVKKIQKRPASEPWDDVLLVIEALSLLLVYAAGNYLVVRELSAELMYLVIEPGSDIPFAFLFYALTVVIPIAYLYFGLKRKDLVLIRVSLAVIAFSVFTFKYYYSLGHPEISLTVAGACLITVTLLIFRYLKTPKHGYTRDSILEEAWSNANLEGFVVSQTLGGNQAAVPEQQGGGGDFGGAGSTESF
jgi:hypothetical protein